MVFSAISGRKRLSSYPAVACEEVESQVTVTSSAANSPATISPSGTGVAPASVALCWTASRSSDIVGYNQYHFLGHGGNDVSDSAYQSSVRSTGVADQQQDEKHPNKRYKSRNDHDWIKCMRGHRLTRVGKVSD